MGGGGGGEGGGRWEAKGGLKQPFRLKVCDTNRTKEAKTDMRNSLVPPCSPINATQDHEMLPCGSTASIKSRL